jgi:hypothetical protein
MATSTNYGWSEPDNTSLVKDGALAIRTLGNAIDTSLWNSGYGQAGKNKVINGNFNVWQRGTTFNATTTGSFTADRWCSIYINGTVNVTQQAFTAGTAPVAGYESQYFIRMARTATHASIPDYFCTKIEDVRTFAAQPVTVSFWAKGSSAFSISAYLDQAFGSGGSSTVGSAISSFSVTTSWQRFSYSVTLASIAGKTIGTGSNLQPVFSIPVAAGNVSLDLWGLQVEYGSTATPFQTASGGSIQGELAMCQRYYQQGNYGWPGVGSNTTTCVFFGNFAPMRTAPSVGATAAIKITDAVAADFTQSSVNISINSSTRVTTQSIFVQCPNFTSTVAYRPYFLLPNEGGAIQLSAEL